MTQPTTKETVQVHIDICKARLRELVELKDSHELYEPNNNNIQDIRKEINQELDMLYIYMENAE